MGGMMSAQLSIGYGFDDQSHAAYAISREDTESMIADVVLFNAPETIASVLWLLALGDDDERVAGICALKSLIAERES
jgi:hypothetical protein